MDELTAAVVGVLRAAPTPRRLPEIADEVGAAVADVDRCLWSQPDVFIWQPGHRWALAEQKQAFIDGLEVEESLGEARTFDSTTTRELKATVLANGMELRVTSEPSDSQAFFTVRPGGAALELIINSSHDLFQTFPLPFSDDGRPWGARALLELLLESWALYESSLPPGQEKRELQSVRMLWGRRAVELLEDGE